MPAAYDFKSSNTSGPINFGPTSSGGGTVVFGSGNPGATAAVANITSNPLILFGLAAAALVALYLWRR